MIVRDATRVDIETVVHLMRADDAREVYAGRFVDDAQALADDIVAGRPYCIALKALCAGEFDPIAIIGARLRWPGVASILMIATDRWPEIAFAATRWVKRVAIPVYVAPNCHRGQCEAWIGNGASRVWLGMLGFENEGTLHAYGKNGEDFLQYAWLRPSPPANRPITVHEEPHEHAPFDIRLPESIRGTDRANGGREGGGEGLWRRS